MAASDESQPDRRAFFRDGLARAIGPLANYLADHIPERDEPRWLRPPGAIAENGFDTTCARCAACVEACPADAIIPATDDDEPATGTPMIRAVSRACVVCEGLQCTQVCPSGALLPLVEPTAIDMGYATVHAHRCVRTQGERCTACVDACPMGSEALVFDGPGPPIVKDACVGCGVCEERCPTEPRAIVVISGRSVGGRRPPA
jgi:ferredoxin-type protein NapG